MCSVHTALVTHVATVCVHTVHTIVLLWLVGCHSLYVGGSNRTIYSLQANVIIYLEVVFDLKFAKALVNPTQGWVGEVFPLTLYLKTS